MRPCGRNCYATESHAQNAFHAHPGAEEIQYCGGCDAWHITRRGTRLPRRSPVRAASVWRSNVPVSPPPTTAVCWRSQWYNVGAYTAGDATEHNGRVWLAVVNYTTHEPGTSRSWREVTGCLGEPLCAPDLCGPPCHHKQCPERSLPAGPSSPVRHTAPSTGDRA